MVVNHLHFREPVTEETLQAAQGAMRQVVEAGGSAARVVAVDPTHLILLLEFPSASEADRIAREVGGPWMREHVVPLLARPTERSVGEVVVDAQDPPGRGHG
jgi:hypothetical protein